MKSLILFFSILSFTSFSVPLVAQTDCSVLKPGIDSVYFGKCKKGLAHGKGNAIGVDSYIGRFANGLPDGQGTYTWANGDTYSGSWMAGKQHGEGVFVLKLEDL